MRTSDHTYACLLKLIIKGELFKPEKIDYSFLLNNVQIKEKVAYRPVCRNQHILRCVSGLFF
jgi:hypothetical protein